MAEPTDWTEAQTAHETFVLESANDSGVLVAEDLTGLTVELVLKDKSGTAVTTTGDVAIVTAASGKVKYTPDSTDLLASGSPYTARFKVTYGDSSIRYFPQGAAMRWNVYPQ